ncbi:protein translocase subunit SecD [Candidatus Babeliales bacterium]|nr:protein translocase subunit SecD [Candidatus Babeliales bacterium]
MAYAHQKRLFFSGFSAWILAALLGGYYLAPVFIPGAQSKPLKFGIDLVGGTYISLEVDTDKAVEDMLYEHITTIRNELKHARLPLPDSSKVTNKQIIMTFDSDADARDVSGFLRDELTDIRGKQDGASIVFTLSKGQEARIRKSAIDSNITVLQNRMNKFAVSEVTVAAQGDRNIIVELPNVDDPERAKAMIGKAALLEFKLVEEEAYDMDALLDKYDGEIPDGMMVVPGKVKRGYESERAFYLVQRHTDVTGRLLRDAYPKVVDVKGWGIAFEFSTEGGRRFHDLTSKNIGRRLGIIIDNEMISAPQIQDAIRSSGSISGNFTQEQAKELADLLKSGAYVAPVSFGEERQVGPSLGAEAIRMGTLACLLGLLLLFLFSVFYYRLPGIFAFGTLLYNLLLILLILSWFGGTLTLPGIAGLVLTLGMAIDSSILIYERIREELAVGAPLGRAVDHGFSGALAVILDANITTFIMGVVLFKFGTGPVQGFAITLMIGILTTLVTGLFFLRSIFSFVVKRIGVQTLKF